MTRSLSACRRVRLARPRWCAMIVLLGAASTTGCTRVYTAQYERPWRTIGGPLASVERTAEAAEASGAGTADADDANDANDANDAGEQRTLVVDTQRGNIEIVLDPVIDAVRYMARTEAGAWTRGGAVGRAEKLATSERWDGGTLTVRALPDGGWRTHDGVSVDVRVPADLFDSIIARTSYGTIRVEGIEDAELILETDNGDILLESTSGSAECDSGIGNVIVDGHGGPIVARTGGGRVEVRLADEAAGPATLTANGGGVRFEFGPAFVGDVDARTATGVVRVESLNDGSTDTVAARVVDDRVEVFEQVSRSSVASDSLGGRAWVRSTPRHAEEILTPAGIRGFDPMRRRLTFTARRAGKASTVVARGGDVVIVARGAEAAVARPTPGVGGGSSESADSDSDG